MKDPQVERLAREMLDYRCPRFDQLPGLPLYRDQLLDTLNGYLAPFYAPGDGAPVTAAMINNYVKLRVIAPPEKKRYSRAQLAQLYVVFLFKQVLSIGEIRDMMAIQSASYPLPVAYDYFCTEMEKALAATFGSRDFSAPSSARRVTPESELVRSAALAVANKVFTVKFLALTRLHALDPGGQLDWDRA